MASGVAVLRHAAVRLGGRVAGTVATVAIVLSLAACGVVLDAPEVSLLVREDTIVYVGGDRDAGRVVGGETVLRVSNDSSEPRQVVLARVGDAESIPPGILEAESPRDDDRIIGMSHELDPKESAFQSGGFGYEYDTVSFHVFLEPGQRYVLFDRLGGYQDGVVLEIVVPDPEEGAAT